MTTITCFLYWPVPEWQQSMIAVNLAPSGNGWTKDAWISSSTIIPALLKSHGKMVSSIPSSSVPCRLGTWAPCPTLYDWDWYWQCEEFHFFRFVPMATWWMPALLTRLFCKRLYINNRLNAAIFYSEKSLTYQKNGKKIHHQDERLGLAIS